MMNRKESMQTMGLTSEASTQAGMDPKSRGVIFDCVFI